MRYGNLLSKTKLRKMQIQPSVSSVVIGSMNKSPPKKRKIFKNIAPNTKYYVT